MSLDEFHVRPTPDDPRLSAAVSGIDQEGREVLTDVVSERPLTLFRAFAAGLFGRLGDSAMEGVHVKRGDEIRIEGDRSSVILDGELFEANAGHPIVLTPTAPVPFLRLAA